MQRLEGSHPGDYGICFSVGWSLSFARWLLLSVHFRLESGPEPKRMIVWRAAFLPNDGNQLCGRDVPARSPCWVLVKPEAVPEVSFFRGKSIASTSPFHETGSLV
jgi:hypothetical protein